MMDEKLNFSYLFGSNAPYIEELYENYLTDPNSIDEHWKQYFDQLAAQPGNAVRDIAHRPIQESFANLARNKSAAAATDAAGSTKKRFQTSASESGPLSLCFGECRRSEKTPPLLAVTRRRTSQPRDRCGSK